MDSATPAGFVSLVAAPTLVTMALAGVWHGSGTQYLVYGLLHGCYITVNHALRIFNPKPKNPPPLSWPVRAINHAWKVLAVYLAALVGFVFFRASSTTAALGMMSGMLGMRGLHDAGAEGGVPLYDVARVAVLFAIVWGAPNTQQIMGNFEPVLGQFKSIQETAVVKYTAYLLSPYGAFFRNGIMVWSPNLTWAGIAVLLFIECLTRITRISPFLYFQF